REAVLRAKPTPEAGTMSDVAYEGNNPFSVRVEPELRARFIAALKANGDKVTDVLRESIEGYLRLQDDSLWREAMARADANGDKLDDLFEAFLRDYLARTASREG